MMKMNLKTISEIRKRSCTSGISISLKFFECGAIMQAQYDKIFGDLTEKMGMGELIKDLTKW